MNHPSKTQDVTYSDAQMRLAREHKAQRLRKQADVDAPVVHAAYVTVPREKPAEGVMAVNGQRIRAVGDLREAK